MRTLCLLATLVVSAAANADTVERFKAVVSNAGAIAPGGATSTELGMTGVADFTLTVPSGGGSPTLAYEMVFSGVDFLGDADPDNDATAVHLHDTTGVDHSTGTPHVLNVFGFPSQDDADAVYDRPAARITGLWDDGDLTAPGLAHAGNPMANSDTLSSMLGALRAGELFLMLHTTSPNAVPGTPGITVGGPILPVPEPGSAGLVVLAFCGFTGRSRRRRIDGPRGGLRR